MNFSSQHIDAAAQALVDARLKPRGRLAEQYRPQSLEQAQAVQHAVLQKAKERIGGWKVGRIGGTVYSALLPANAMASSAAEVALPEGAKIELELATRFHERLSRQDISRLRLDDLPSVTECVALFEFVNSRFRQDENPDTLEKIADNVSTAWVVTGDSIKDWSLSFLLDTCAVLYEDDIEVARHGGPHLSAPLNALFKSWRNRCMHEQLTVEPGQLITWGSLSGVRPVPTEGAGYLGSVGNILTVRCRANCVAL